MYAALIGIHAAAGLMAVGAGFRVIATGDWFRLYFGSLVACIAFVVGAVALDWDELDGGTRVLFVALFALGGYMILRGARAGRRLTADTVTPSVEYVDDVGFTIVALLDAFVVIGVLDLVGSGYAAAAAALFGAAIGHRSLEAYKRALRERDGGAARR
jgi:hypothetical protein